MRRKLTASLVLVALASSTALGGARQDAKVLMSPDPASLKIEEEWGFCDAIVTGDTIYLSGVVAGVREAKPTCVSPTREPSNESARS